MNRLFPFNFPVNFFFIKWDYGALSNALSLLCCDQHQPYLVQSIKLVFLNLSSVN
jgi:hypothetical protein